jgi:hypothetical protein
MPFTLRNLREDVADVGSNFDGAPGLEFRHATKPLGLEQSGLSYQRIPPGTSAIQDSRPHLHALLSNAVAVSVTRYRCASV